MHNSTEELYTLAKNGGVPRDQVLRVLITPRIVKQAVKIGRCFQCKSDDIDVTGLCLLCRSYLNDEERKAAQFFYDAI